MFSTEQKNEKKIRSSYTGCRIRQLLSSSCGVRHIADEVGKLPLRAVNFEFDFTVWLEAGHHDLDRTEDEYGSLDHLATELACSIALDDRPAPLCMVMTWTSALPFTTISPPSMYIPISEPALPLTRILPPDNASPVAAIGSAKVVAGITLDDHFSAFHGGCCEGTDITLCEDLAALHPGTDILVGSFLNDEFPGAHLEPEVLDLLHIALDNYFCVGCSCACIAAHVKILARVEGTFPSNTGSSAILAAVLPANASGETVSVSRYSAGAFLT